MDKKKSLRDVSMTLDHNNRERQPANADPEKKDRNWTFGGSTQEAITRFNERLPAKIRKNAVLAVELVMTASPDFSGDWSKYLNACDAWARGLFGEKNLIHVAHHRDEKTPHTHIVFMPLKDGKLNAKHFIGGSRDRMAELQQDFYEKVGKEFKLDRGKPREETRARHTQHNMTNLDQRELAIAKKETELKEIEKSIAQGNAAVNEIYRISVIKKWQPSFAKRVMDYSVKKFPEFIDTCSEDVRHYKDQPIISRNDRQKQAPSRGR
jgi:hypothetical protein